jgi:SAM-dependent methyltransferase
MEEYTLLNRETYQTKDVVECYARDKHLQPPEATILSELRPALGGMKMLDIGVGAGRTTAHFAPLVKEYVGVDYSEPMIQMCEQRFGKRQANVNFRVADATCLTSFQDRTFDFVLFSFNGIDSLSHEERIRALKEMRRVTVAGGRVLFSTHNVTALTRRMPQISWNPKRALAGIRAFMNRPYKDIAGQLGGCEYVVVNDGAHGGRLRNFYVRPSFQVRELEGLGFKGVRVFSLESGREIAARESLDGRFDAWLYFLCGV